MLRVGSTRVTAKPQVCREQLIQLQTGLGVFAGGLIGMLTTEPHRRAFRFALKRHSKVNSPCELCPKWPLPGRILPGRGSKGTLWRFSSTMFDDGSKPCLSWGLGSRHEKVSVRSFGHIRLSYELLLSKRLASQVQYAYPCCTDTFLPFTLHPAS